MQIAKGALPLSIAASWAWGTSLIVGMQIAQQKGLTAWGIWATANCLTLVLFGALARCGFLTKELFERKSVKWMALLIQMFCLVVNLNILNMVAIQMGATASQAYAFATAVGCTFVAWMYWRGLEMSIITDKYQAMLTGALLTGIVGLGLYNGELNVVHVESTINDILWGAQSACILLAGPIGDLMHYQRAEIAGKSHAFTQAGLIFAIYLLLVLAASFFQFNFAMNALLILAVLCVTSSTIDSIAVALHEMVNKKVGTAVGVSICVFWGIFAEMGVIELWSKAGVFRVAFALFILLLAWSIYRKRKENSL